MDNVKTKPTVGDLKISQDVVAAIVRVAALETEGVDSLAEPANVRSMKLAGLPMIKKAISITLSDDFVNVAVSVNLKYGAKISEVCTSIQNSVKDNVQTMTGMAVSKVNIFVAGVIIPEDKAE